MHKKTNGNLKVNLKNYEMVFNHYKEQDQLRNTAFGFFTSLTIAAAGLIGVGKVNMVNTALFFVIFLAGVIISIVLCRYRTYALFYSYTLSIYRKILIKNDGSSIKRSEIINIIEEKMEKEKKKKGWKKLYSSDLLLYLSLIIINSLNLFIVFYMFGISIFNFRGVNVENYLLYFYGAIIIIVFIYIFLAYKVYTVLVFDYVEKSLSNGKLDSLLFLDMYINTDNK